MEIYLVFSSENKSVFIQFMNLIVIRDAKFSFNMRVRQNKG